MKYQPKKPSDKIRENIIARVKSVLPNRTGGEELGQKTYYEAAILDYLDDEQDKNIRILEQGDQYNQQKISYKEYIDAIRAIAME